MSNQGMCNVLPTFDAGVTATEAIKVFKKQRSRSCTKMEITAMKKW